jgi:transcriptional regulator with XRE-family HTH domain
MCFVQTGNGLLKGQNEKISGFQPIHQRRCLNRQQDRQEDAICQEERMSDSALGFLLRAMRNERGLTLREIAQLADVDHAYVQRLETGEKTAPSDDVLTKLTKALKAPKREAEMLTYLAKNPDTALSLIEFVRQDSAITFGEFRGLATFAHRGTARPDYATNLRRLRAMWGDDGDNG